MEFVVFSRYHKLLSRKIYNHKTSLCESNGGDPKKTLRSEKICSAFRACIMDIRQGDAFICCRNDVIFSRRLAPTHRPLRRAQLAEWVADRRYRSSGKRSGPPLLGLTKNVPLCPPRQKIFHYAVEHTLWRYNPGWYDWYDSWYAVLCLWADPTLFNSSYVILHHPPVACCL